MGKASRRKAEQRAARANSSHAAVPPKALVVPGINPASPDPTIPIMLARDLSRLFREAKQTGNVDPAVQLLESAVQSTLQGLSRIPVACKKGCSHCCYTWVSVSAPEAIRIAKMVKQRGPAAIEKVRAAYEETKEYDFEHRSEHPSPCPLLENDACSIYSSRPKGCRLAASPDAERCARAFHNITNESLTMPALHVTGRAAYALVLAAALQHEGLKHDAYEFNAALLRALETDDIEQRWLAGEDVFAGVHRDTDFVLASPQGQMLYQIAFPNAMIPIHSTPRG